MDDHVDMAGLLRTDAPHVRLAGLRLAQLVREINEALTDSAGDVTVSTQALSTALTFAAQQVQRTLLQLAADVQRLGDRILLAADGVRVADVDGAVADLRLRVRELFALRNICHPRRFAAWEQTHVIDARARIADCLRDFSRHCALMSAMIIHPDRMGADGDADLGVTLDLDLARQLSLIAARARAPIPLWRYY